MNIARYSKKPMAVEAVQLTRENADEVAAWMNGKRKESDAYFPGPGRGVTKGVAIHTLEGVMTAEWGAWVVRGVVGEFWPVREDIFALTYEPVVEDEAP